MSTMKWQHWLAVTGGAAVVGGVMYYLMREDVLEADLKDSSLGQKVDVNAVTKDQVLGILQEIIRSQEKMKKVMKDLTRELVAKPHSFDDVYLRVKQVQPDDPLDKSGLSMPDFDNLLDKYQHDASIRDAIQKIMGAPGPMSMSAKVTSMEKEKIIEVHSFMLKELKNIVEEFQKTSDKESYDMKTVTIAAQALVGAKVEGTYDLSADDIESAVLLHHQTLASDADFANINVQMQSTMSDLMGAHFGSGFM